MHCSTSFETRAHLTNTNNLIICRRVSRRYSNILFFFGTSLIAGRLQILAKPNPVQSIIRLCEIKKLAITPSNYSVGNQTYRYTSLRYPLQFWRRRVIAYTISIPVDYGDRSIIFELRLLDVFFEDWRCGLMHGGDPPVTPGHGVFRGTQAALHEYETEVC